jgi:hypothetical protein
MRRCDVTAEQVAAPTKRIHAAGMLGCIGKRRTWCGLLVDDDQLAIIGTDREVDCLRCARSGIAQSHAKRWGYSHRKWWQQVMKRRAAAAPAKAGGNG